MYAAAGLAERRSNGGADDQRVTGTPRRGHALPRRRRFRTAIVKQRRSYSGLRIRTATVKGPRCSRGMPRHDTSSRTVSDRRPTCDVSKSERQEPAPALGSWVRSGRACSARLWSTTRCTQATWRCLPQRAASNGSPVWMMCNTSGTSFRATAASPLIFDPPLRAT